VDSINKDISAVGTIRRWIYVCQAIMSKFYHFFTQWQVVATREEVYSILSEAEALPRWWPSVYLDVKVTAPGDSNSVGKEVSLYTKGWLPYTLKWNFVVTETRRPTGFSFNAYGDFVGFGKWNFIQAQNICVISFDWKLKVEKPLLRYLSFLLKPVFSANHYWAMKQGEKSLALELKRRRTANAFEKNSIASPPGPTFPHNVINNKIFVS
jgi:hypothetical protein